MNNRKAGVNWDELRSKLSAFDIPIYPFESCTIGELRGIGAAMAVYEGIYLLRLLFASFSNHVNLTNMDKHRESYRRRYRKRRRTKKTREAQPKERNAASYRPSPSRAASRDYAHEAAQIPPERCASYRRDL